LKWIIKDLENNLVIYENKEKKKVENIYKTIVDKSRYKLLKVK